MSKGRFIITNMIGVIIILALLAGGGYYYYQNHNYVTTDEATVYADMTNVTAPASGTLKGWKAKEGDDVSRGQNLGEVFDGQQPVPVDSLSEGKLIKNNAVNHQSVQAGEVIGQTADMDHLYIIANIKETELHEIEKGDKVNITVDGDQDTTFEGEVKDIAKATNSAFSMLPENTSGNYTKVTEEVQVKISIFFERASRHECRS
ncbi:hypothetical protein BGLY_3482 [Bacillus glycinifermentans]|nr:hypothetical protein BGLY_3482 [Bacillus glycinifermentans]